MLSSWPFARHAAAWAQARSSTQRPIGTISPFSSAIGMNTSGRTTPAVGWFQRSSASTPTIRSLSRSSIGW